MKRVCVIILVSTLALTAGCVDPDAVVTVQSLNNSTEVTKSASIELEETSTAVEQAVIDGRSNATDSEIRDSELVLYEGKYYNISRERAGTDNITIAEINVSETELSANYTSTELQSKDIEPIRDFNRYDDGDISRDFFSQRYTPNNIESSVLLKEENIVVRFEGENYRLKINRTEEIATELFTYTSEVSFESSEEYYNHIESEYMFELENIPNGSEDIWDEAVDGGYYGESTEGFEKLRERFEREDAFEMQEYQGQWYVRHNGQMYKVKIDWISG